MRHPLHLGIAEEIARQLPSYCELRCDSACGGKQQLPLFVGPAKNRTTRMCCVDLLILADGKVRGIMEIEESGFLPTKICGKFFQTALTTHFIHAEGPIPYADKVFFIQVLDGSKCLKSSTQKYSQAKLIEKHIQQMLPLGMMTDYALFVVLGTQDESGLSEVSNAAVQFLR